MKEIKVMKFEDFINENKLNESKNDEDIRQGIYDACEVEYTDGDEFIVRENGDRIEYSAKRIDQESAELTIENALEYLKNEWGLKDYKVQIYNNRTGFSLDK